MSLPTLDVEQIETTIGVPFDQWARKCHSISLKIVQARMFPGARVARGWTPGVRSQHSWVALGDIYAPDCVIVDPTLWSYVDEVTGIWVGIATDRPHTPHGAGSIYRNPPPYNHGEATIELTPATPLSPAAAEFLDILGPLDAQGWGQLAHAPVLDWPSEEIIAAMYDTPALKALVPIDIVGMLTDRNPQGLYLESPT